MPNTNVHKMYMRIAHNIATQSYCERKKVGAVLVKNNRIISDGYNGMPASMPNCCEIDGNLTRDEVLHAEANALAKVGKSTNSSEGSVIYITLSPCKDCAKLLKQFGIIKVYYCEKYRILDGLNFLKEVNIETEQIDI